MKLKKVNAGNVMGLSTYQLAVLSGKFTGSLEEFLDKEQEYYNNTIEYVEAAKSRMEELLASIVESQDSPELSELINARGAYKILGERLNATDDELHLILDKLNKLSPETINIDAIKITGSNRNVDLRNNGVAIQWRIVGETSWQDLLQLSDMTPNLKIGSVGTSTDNVAKASITGTRNNPLLNLILPKGKDGVDGGSIIDFRVNDNGEGIVTVLNKDDELTQEFEGNTYLIPVLSIGEVTTVDYDQPASVTIDGTLANPKLNFAIPRGKPCKIKTAHINSDGWWEFEYE